MKRLLVFFVLGLACAATAQRITVKGNQFIANGKPIWISGTNTPWDKWNDFGMSYNAAWWSAEFGRLKQAHVNATRVWISCSGQNPSPGITADGRVTPPTKQFWADLDRLFALAKKERIYVMTALISFDHTKDGNPNAAAWREMQASAKNRQAFTTNYVEPLVKRYGANPYFWAIDVGNEIDWHWDNQRLRREDTLDLIARVAKVVHSNSKVLVCQGMGTATKYMNGKENVLSNASLGRFQRGAYVDFYNTHYYDWVRTWFGSPYEKTPESYGIGDKPCVIGETPAKGAAGMSITENYRQAYAHGWQGIMPWTSNGVDSNGGLDASKAGAAWFYGAHRNLLGR